MPPEAAGLAQRLPEPVHHPCLIVLPGGVLLPRRGPSSTGKTSQLTPADFILSHIRGDC